MWKSVIAKSVRSAYANFQRLCATCVCNHLYMYAYSGIPIYM